MSKNKYTAKTIFSFFGPPGSGKGTLAQECVKKFGFVILSTGNLCRKHVSLGTDFGKQISHYLDEGKLIPDDLIASMVGDWLISKSFLQVPIILDGFPRTKGQAESFLNSFNDFIPGYKFRVINFIISEEEILKRLTNRFVCQNYDCQSVYPPFALAVKKAICDVCGEKLVKRSDDKIDVIKHRLSKYSEYRDDLLNFYKLVGQNIEDLNIENENIEQVFQLFKKNILGVM